MQIVIELKTVMTEHHKTAKNRKRDLEAHHEHVHKYSAQALAGGILLTNIAKRFDSPPRKEGDITAGLRWSQQRRGGPCSVPGMGYTDLRPPGRPCRAWSGVVPASNRGPVALRRATGAAKGVAALVWPLRYGQAS